MTVEQRTAHVIIKTVIAHITETLYLREEDILDSRRVLELLQEYRPFGTDMLPEFDRAVEEARKYYYRKDLTEEELDRIFMLHLYEDAKQAKKLLWEISEEHVDIRDMFLLWNQADYIVDTWEPID